MRVLIEKAAQHHGPESLVEQLRGQPGVVLLRSSLFESSQARYSFVVARPFLTFRSAGSVCEVRWPGGGETRFGDPWRVLESLVARYELTEEIDLPFPLGGCFGYWGYDLKNFLEPRLSRRALNDLDLPHCHLGFYDSLVVFDHHLKAAWIIATGLDRHGAADERRARQQLDFFRERVEVCGAEEGVGRPLDAPDPGRIELPENASRLTMHPLEHCDPDFSSVLSNLSASDFLSRIERAQAYIRSGDIYQVNLSQRLTTAAPVSGWEIFRSLNNVSPGPFSAYLDCEGFELASSSPELFLRLSGSHVRTRPIKGTRPRSADATQDAQFSYQLQTSPKEMAELVMITDLLRNDLGKVCEFGSVHVPELARLERYPQVQHLVSTVEGSLRAGVTHLDALAACFPGGSITGAPKFRAMEIIDELEPICRGPYTGALGYLGFNCESQFSIVIRTALHKDGLLHFQVGAGIVADSRPQAEYIETLAKARGFIEALRSCRSSDDRLSQRQIRS